MTLNPATGQLLQLHACLDDQRLRHGLEHARGARRDWAQTPLAARAAILSKVARLLTERCDQYVAQITQGMGKLLAKSRAEVEKCSLLCEYFAQHAEEFLRPETIATDTEHSQVEYRPLGVAFAIMPWNFPFWQAFRDCGLPEGVYTNLMIEVKQSEQVVASPHVHAVTLTGSEAAGRKVAALAGQHLKKCVLELGGSDPFVVLHDADLEYAVEMAVKSRFLNCGQSCIAAKRIIVVPQIADEFLHLLKEKVEALRPGDPTDAATTLAPMARHDLREALHEQVRDSIAQGAVAVTGCRPLVGDGFFYRPSILDHVTPATRAYHEELFGPVAVVIRAEDEDDALRIANNKYGLGSSIWSRDTARAERLAERIQAGSTFINGMVKSDPRLPFGGIKASGYGRELSRLGILEFVNAKTVWVR